MNSNELKKEIRQTIYSNRFGDISGNELRDILLEIVNSQNRINGDFEEANIIITNPNGEFVDSGKKLSDILTTSSTQGATGPQGATGLRGPKGDTGPQGATGETGENGLTPFIGENGNWWIGTTDTGVQAQGPTGGSGSGEGVIYTAGSNIDITDNIISALGYKYDKEKKSLSIGSSTTTAPGQNSHAEGYWTTASGDNSHSEGYRTTASGNGSHAEGFWTKTIGKYSHAEGNVTTTNNDYEHAQGCYNISNNGATIDKQTIHSIGIGTSEANKNAQEVMQNGDHYIIGIGGYNGANINEEGVKTLQEVIEDISTSSPGGTNYTAGSNINIDSENNTISAIGYVYEAEKKSFKTGIDTEANGYYSSAEGSGTIANGTGAHAEGVLTGATGFASHAEGLNTQSTKDGAHAEGYGTVASGIASHAEGSGTIASGFASHTEGENTIASNYAEHAQGNLNISNTGATTDKQTIHSIGIGANGARKNAQEVMQNGDHYIFGIGGYDGTNIDTAQTLQQVINSGGGSGEGGKTYYAGNNIEIENNIISAIGYSYDKDNNSFAEGVGNYSNGIGSHTEGSRNVANGSYSHAEGDYNYANGVDSHAEGYGTRAEGYASHTEGSATIGLGKCSHAEGDASHAEGDASHAEGSGSIGVGQASHAEGYETTASGDCSHAEGSGTIAYGLASHAGGYNSQANGENSFVHGYNCTVHTSGENAHTIGIDNYISDSGCIALGRGLTSYRQYCTYLGQYNKLLPGDWNDVIAVVGDGTDSSNQRNIVVIQSGNEPSVHCRGAFKNDATWINDFGEYFEWADGNPNNEDRVGYMVQLNDEKIELAQSYEKCIGVVSATAGFIGGACSFDWHGIYLRDEFGRYILDENGNPMVNPEYDESKEYLPRSKRPEWSIIGILGQVITRQDGTLISGGFASCINGIATAADSGYSVLKVLNDKTALLLIK